MSAPFSKWRLRMSTHASQRRYSVVFTFQELGNSPKLVSENNCTVRHEFFRIISAVTSAVQIFARWKVPGREMFWLILWHSQWHYMLWWKCQILHLEKNICISITSKCTSPVIYFPHVIWSINYNYAHWLFDMSDRHQLLTTAWWSEMWKRYRFSSFFLVWMPFSILR